MLTVCDFLPVRTVTVRPATSVLKPDAVMLMDEVLHLQRCYAGGDGYRQRIQVGLPHAGRIVTIEPGGTTLRIIDPNGELLVTVPRNSTGTISRFKAHGSKHSH